MSGPYIFYHYRTRTKTKTLNLDAGAEVTKERWAKDAVGGKPLASGKGDSTKTAKKQLLQLFSPGRRRVPQEAVMVDPRRMHMRL